LIAMQDSNLRTFGSSPTFTPHKLNSKTTETFHRQITQCPQIQSGTSKLIAVNFPSRLNFSTS